MVVIEHTSFMDILLDGETNTVRVLYEKGDVLFIRNDIPHRGTENIGDFEHYRVHVMTIPRIFKYPDDRKIQLPYSGFPLPPEWCNYEQTYSMSLK